MDIKEVNAWRMNPLLCVSGHTLDAIDWLINEHDRLTARLASVEQENSELRAENDLLKRQGGIYCHKDSVCYAFRKERETRAAEVVNLRAELEREKGERAQEVEACKEAGMLEGMDAVMWQDRAEQAESALAAALEEAAKFKFRLEQFAGIVDGTITAAINEMDTLRAQLAAAQLHAEGQVWPAERKGVLLQVSVVAHDVPPFIYGANGHITSMAMEEIERQMEEDAPEELGDYLYEASWEKGDETFAPYWDLTQVGFRAEANQPQGKGGSRESARRG